MLREVVAEPRWVEGMKFLLDHTQSDWTGLTVATHRA